MKKGLLIICILCIAFLFGCSSEKEDIKQTEEPIKTLKVQATPTAVPTQTPTPSPTPAPAATVEPGKETYAGEILDAQNGIGVNLSPMTGNIKDETITDNLAVQFFATTTFNTINVNCVSYGNNTGTIIFNLYKWMGSYYATLESEPVAKKEYVDFNDNSILSLPFEIPLPDGEYLLLLTTTEPNEGVGVYTNADVTDAKTRLYKNDEVVEAGAIYMSINYTKTPKNVSGPIQDPGF